ncbi:MAG: ABC transporter substrate-binding protein [Flavobacteriaceae bacterium]|nr:MAG: ABC transporter substrate-binding protein [Flavobacteriaceae bacterium]
MNKHGKQIYRLVVFLLMLLMVLLGPERSLASSNNDPLVQLQKSVDEILMILQSEELKAPAKKDERKQLILDVVNEMFDFHAMARSSLGKNWNNLTVEEQDRFVGLFTGLIEQRYVGKIEAYNDQKVVYKEKRVKNNQARVYTAIIDKDLEIPIDYSLKMSQQGKWLIKDLRIENVSLIANYRRDFNSIIKKEKFAGLVEKISEQLEKTEPPK